MNEEMTWLERNRRLEKAARVGVIIMGAGFLIFNLVRIIHGPIGDFHNHWKSGYDLLRGGSLYMPGGEGPSAYPNPYPPFWAMAHAPLTIFTAHVAQVIVFLPMYIGSLVLLVWTLLRLTRPHFPLDGRRQFWAVAIAMLVALQFVLRDMAECGVNIGLVALAWFAVYAWTRHRDWLGGTSLGLAIALKMTAALFVPYFLWKRQWKIAGTATLFAVMFTMSPVLVRGPTRFGKDLSEWLDIVRSGKMGNPSIGVLGPEPISNFALRPALARLITDNPGATSNPVATNIAFLPPRVASTVVYFIEFSLLLLFACMSGRSVDDRGALPVLYECAGVSLLILLLSPITWGHHCVGTVPALYLICATAFYFRGLPRWMLIPVGYILLTLVFNRAIVGAQVSLLMSGYSIVTWEILALLVLTLGCRSLVARSTTQ
jgi:alpha-1,2-mannosyltransferase